MTVYAFVVDGERLLYKGKGLTSTNKAEGIAPNRGPKLNMNAGMLERGEQRDRETKEEKAKSER